MADLETNSGSGLGAGAYSPPEHQQRVDALFAAARAEAARPGGRVSIFKPPPPRPSASDDPLDHRIAEELEVIRRRLDQIGAVLSAEPILLHRHAATLQSLDLTNQVLGHLARVVASKEKELALDQVSLGDLKARLTRRPLAALAG